MEGRTALTLGLNADYLSRWQFDVSYTQYAGKQELVERPRFRHRHGQILLLGAMKMKALTTRLGTALVLACALASPVSAELSADDVARLGTDLTPLSAAERAGNADGTIPEWTGGHHKAAGGLPTRRAPPRPVRRRQAALRHRPVQPGPSTGTSFPRDTSVMLETYPTFKLTVYPTRRSASAPRRIYDATRNIAAVTPSSWTTATALTARWSASPFPFRRTGRK